MAWYGETTPSNPRTYTEADVQKFISDTKAEAGRRIKTLETEAQASKAQAENLETSRSKELAELEGSPRPGADALRRQGGTARHSGKSSSTFAARTAR